MKTVNFSDNLRLLIEQYKSKEKFISVLESMNTQAESVQSALCEIIEKMKLDSGVGVQLDLLGRVLDLPRNGRDDDSYRTLLKIKALLNNTSGERETLITLIENLYNATKVQINNNYPAKITIWQNGDVGLYLFHEMKLDDAGLLELDDGDILELQQPDDITEDLIFDLLPVGVGVTILSDLLLDDNNPLYLDDGGIMIVT